MTVDGPPRAPAAYRALLRLLPPGFRRRWGRDLEAVMADRLRDAAGPAARARVWAVATVDVATTAPVEWARAIGKGRGNGREAAPETRRGGGMEALLQDAKYAVRSLANAPVFAVVAVLTLALGIGANTAIFSVVNAVLLRPLPYADPDRLVRVQGGWGESYGDWLSQPEIVDLEGVEAVAAVGAWTGVSANLTGDGEPERVQAVQIMPEALRLLGAEPLLGRSFTEEEGTPGAADGVALVSEGLFHRRFGGDPGVVGRTIQVNGSSRVVVGVLPADFRLLTDFQGEATDLFVPMPLDRDSLLSRGNHSYHTVARLRDGVTLEQARQQLEALGARLTAEGFYAAERPFSFRPVPVREDVFGAVRPALLVLLGAVGFVLLIACANVANLLLARGEERQKEMAVRVAMGADRLRIVRQLLTESLLLAVLGGVAGVGLALVGTRALLALDPASLPRVQAVGVDGPVLVFTLLVALGTGLVFGAAPAVQALRHEAQASLKEGGRGATAGRARQRFRRFLAVGELALAVVLVIGAGLMVRTFQALRAIEPGFEPAGVLSMRLSLPSSSYPTDADVVGFYDRLAREAAEVPGARSAGVVRMLPLAGTIGDWSIDLEGYEEGPGENPHGDWQSAGPGYFETMGLRLVEGRLFDATDDADAPPVVVVNRTMADTYWPDGAVGKRFRTGSQRPWTTVVGVVEDVRHNALVEEPREEMIHPHAQYPVALGFAPQTMTLVVKAEGDPAALAGPVREVIRRMDPSLPVSDVRAVEDVVADAVAGQRFTMTLLGVFGAVALALAVIGIYGVLSYAVSRRMHEMGIRQALGAERGAVVRLVVGDGMRLAAGGLALGLALAAGLTRVMASLLYGVEAVDPLTFAAVPALLLAAAFLATWLPARRASGVPPSEALRVG